MFMYFLAVFLAILGILASMGIAVVAVVRYEEKIGEFIEKVTKPLLSAIDKILFKLEEWLAKR